MPYSEVSYNSPPFLVFLSIYMLPRYFVNALINVIKIIYNNSDRIGPDERHFRRATSQQRNA